MIKNFMALFIEQLIQQNKDLFTSQDSKFYILTAFKLTLIPILSFLTVLYSIWTIMEMNFSFFSTNGFNQSREIFYALIFSNIQNYFVYFFLALFFTFMFGLFTSYLALRAFEHIEDHTSHLKKDIKKQFKVSSLNQKKLIYQVSRIFFTYIQLYIQNNRAPEIHLPTQIENLKTPPLDKVFLMQYAFVVVIIILGTSSLLFSFTQELHQEIIKSGLGLLPTNPLIADFLDSQGHIFFNVYLIGISTNIIAYILIAKNIIKNVDGVCYGFARDMVKVIKGQHKIRLKPRYKDPGHQLASIINQTLDEAFPLPLEDKNFYQAVEETLSQLQENYTPHFNSTDELNGSTKPENLENNEGHNESQVLKLIFQGKKIKDSSKPARTRLPEISPYSKNKKTSGE